MKKPWLPICVISAEALEKCLVYRPRLFSLEGAPYLDFKAGKYSMSRFSEYEWADYPEKEFALFKKVRGKNVFDDENYFISFCLLP